MVKKIAHIAIAVKNLEEAVKTYEKAFGLRLEHVETVAEQGVKTAFLPVGESHVELLEPLNEASGVAKFIERRGEGIHHICFEVEDIEKELEALAAKGLELIDRKPRRGVEGKIAFLHPRSAQGVLVELVQRE